jgi:hypothetical protein
LVTGNPVTNDENSFESDKESSEDDDLKMALKMSADE